MRIFNPQVPKSFPDIFTTQNLESMRNKYSIKPILRKDKVREDGKSPIAIQIIINNKLYKRATGEYISLSEWDGENNIIKRSVFRSGLINSRIKHEINDLEEYLNKLSTHKDILSLDDIRNFYRKETKVYLYDFWNEQMELWKKNLRPSTLKNYTCTLNRLKEFSVNPLISEVDYKFISHFDAYLKTKRNNELSGANTRHKCLKVILKEAKRHDIIDKIPYENFKLKKTEGKKVYLTSKELDKLVKALIPEDKEHLNEIKDIDDKVRITMIKTGDFLSTALIKQCKLIVDKYRGKNGIFVFPRRSHQKINKNLKTLIKIAKIYKDVTFHCGRHTFASSLLDKNVEVYDIMQLLGHKNISITMTYMHSLDERKVSVLKVLESDQRQTA
jgi:integrase